VPRRPVHLCEVCGRPVSGEESVCPPCRRELERVLSAADPGALDDERLGVRPDADDGERLDQGGEGRDTAAW
jgi:hypothetical protein